MEVGSSWSGATVVDTVRHSVSVGGRRATYFATPILSCFPGGDGDNWLAVGSRGRFLLRGGERWLGDTCTYRDGSDTSEPPSTATPRPRVAPTATVTSASSLGHFSHGEEPEWMMYRDILIQYTSTWLMSLLSVPAKVFAHICLARMKRTVFAKQRPQQSGFTPGRSTLDRIIALRLLAERRREYRQPLYAAYIDLRAAFDSLDRNSLWNILKTIGIPPKLVDIIKTLYSSTHSVVRVNGTISEAFSISSGVRQGCTCSQPL